MMLTMETQTINYTTQDGPPQQQKLSLIFSMSDLCPMTKSPPFPSTQKTHKKTHQTLKTNMMITITPSPLFAFWTSTTFNSPLHLAYFKLLSQHTKSQKFLALNIKTYLTTLKHLSLQIRLPLTPSRSTLMNKPMLLQKLQR